MISQPTLSLLQQAGESLYAVHHAFAQEVRGSAEQVVAAVASAPFSADADKAYAQLRNLARMAQELQGMEEQLKSLYVAAAAMQTPEMQVVAPLALRSASRARLQREVEAPRDENVEDVIAKPRAPRVAGKTRVRAEPASATPTPRLSANDQKVLAHLRQVLDRRSWTALTQAAIAQGAAIPLGSVGLAVRRLLTAGLLREGTKGHYRLG